VDEHQVSRTRDAVFQMARRLRQQASAGITASQLAVLGSLERSGPLTLGDLADAESVSPPAVSRTVKLLEEEGFVSRVIIEDDRRAALISITPRARRVLQAIRRERNAWLARRIAELTPRQVSDLARGIAVIESMLEQGADADTTRGRQA
jgi:DNA-binding MarR family transcriptional regulator